MQQTIKVRLFDHWITVPLPRQWKVETLAAAFSFTQWKLGTSAGTIHETISLRHACVHAASPGLPPHGCKTRTRTMYTKG